MRLSLVPRPTAFYDLLVRAGANALETARLADARFRDFPAAETTHADVKAAEHRGDQLTRELIQLLNTQYVTPFDREDIYALATTIDDVVDHIEEASDLLELYRIESMTAQAIEQCRILVEAVSHLCAALAKLRTRHGVEEELLVVKSLEDQGDRVVRDAIAALFRGNGIDPLSVIRWKDIFDALEAALDACDTCANVLANVIVKNA